MNTEPATDGAGRADDLTDAGHSSAHPPLTGLEQKAFAAMGRLDRAAAEVESHTGERSGAEYEAKIQAWRDAYAAWRRAMRSVVKGTT